MNKGLSRATGDIVCWINGDDLVFPKPSSRRSSTSPPIRILKLSMAVWTSWMPRGEHGGSTALQHGASADI